MTKEEQEICNDVKYVGILAGTLENILMNMKNNTVDEISY